MIKELLFKTGVMPENYPKLGEVIKRVAYHQKDSPFAIEHGIENGGYCIHYGSGDYHIIDKNVVAVAVYE